MGLRTYTLLKNLTSLLNSSKLGLDTIIKTLMNHYEQQGNVRAERYNFAKRLQGPNEFIFKFVAGLKSIEATYEFGVLEGISRD